jgi:hypothetical protein
MHSDCRPPALRSAHAICFIMPSNVQIVFAMLRLRYSKHIDPLHLFVVLMQSAKRLLGASALVHAAVPNMRTVRAIVSVAS